MKCKHENADHLMPGDSFVPDSGSGLNVEIAACEQFRCIDCGAWLPLGPSNDEPDAVKVEMRAAELAAHRHEMEHRLSSRFKTTYGEIAGWRGEETIESLRVFLPDGGERVDRGTPLNLDSPNWRAGYLARYIVTHEETP